VWRKNASRERPEPGSDSIRTRKAPGGAAAQLGMKSGGPTPLGHWAVGARHPRGSTTVEARTNAAISLWRYPYGIEDVLQRVNGMRAAPRALFAD
jgi:hypothetical protein